TVTLSTMLCSSGPRKNKASGPRSSVIRYTAHTTQERVAPPGPDGSVSVVTLPRPRPCDQPPDWVRSASPNVWWRNPVIQSGGWSHGLGLGSDQPPDWVRS